MGLPAQLWQHRAFSYQLYPFSLLSSALVCIMKEAVSTQPGVFGDKMKPEDVSQLLKGVNPCCRVDIGFLMLTQLLAGSLLIAPKCMPALA